MEEGRGGVVDSSARVFFFFPFGFVGFSDGDHVEWYCGGGGVCGMVVGCGLGCGSLGVGVGLGEECDGWVWGEEGEEEEGEEWGCYPWQ